MQNYLDLLDRIMKEGVDRSDRTGTGTRALFAQQLRFDLFRHGFPAITTKKLWMKGVWAELLWFLSGSTNWPTFRSQHCAIIWVSVA